MGRAWSAAEWSSGVLGGDFFLILTDYAKEHFYVTEETGRSYARLALKPFEKELVGNWRYKRGEGFGATLSKRRM